MSHRTRLPRFALTALALGCSLAAAQGRVTLEVLPLGGPGVSFVEVTGMSAAGHVVGIAYDLNQVPFGWIRQLDGTVQSMGTSSPMGVSSAGVAVGSITSAGGSRSAARWTGRDGWQGTGPGPWAYAINSAGQIAGQGAAGQGWIQTEYVSLVPLQGSQPGSWSYPRGINEAGWAVGQVYDPANAGSAAAVWRPDGTLQTLAGRGGSSWAWAINNRSQVAGVSIDAAQVTSPALWDAGTGTLRLLGDLGTRYGEARALNDAGQVVGFSMTAAGEMVAFAWSESGGMTDLAALSGPGFHAVTASGIDRHARVAVYGSGSATQGRAGAAVLTLQPDWQGGNGHWGDGQHWNWGGTGVANAVLGDMHDVRIAPAGSVVVQGAAEGLARTLQIGGTPGRSATLDLAGGRTVLTGGDGFFRSLVVESGGVLRGQGQVDAVQALAVYTGGRIEVGANQHMALAAAYLENAGLVRVQGTAVAPAQLTLTGGLTNQTGGRIQLTQALATFDGSGSNSGQITLQDAQADFSGAGGYGQLWNTGGGQLLLSFGRSTVAGSIYNEGQVIVSNGAQATFFDAITNAGELRVSAGGAANFFGTISGGGQITGNGEARFEGGISFGASPGLVTVNPRATIGASSPVLMELGGTVPGFGSDRHDKIVFNGLVTLEGGPLNVVWWGGFSGGAGDRFDLFDWNGGLQGQFGAVNLPALGAGLVWQTGDLYAGGSLSIAAVPEPGTWALWLAGLAGVGRIVRRRDPAATSARWQPRRPA